MKIRLYGANETAHHLAQGLLELDLRQLTLVDQSRHSSKKTPTEHLYTQLTTSSSWSHLRIDRHWTLNDASTDLAIIAGPGIEADRAIVAELAHNQIPTLIVNAHLDSARVGPLFVPQNTPCWRCRDCAITETEPAWPQIVTQLSRRIARPQLSIARWAASTALIELLSFITTGTCDLLSHSVCWDSSTAGIRTITARYHPSCGCHQGDNIPDSLSSGALNDR